MSLQVLNEYRTNHQLSWGYEPWTSLCSPKPYSLSHQRAIPPVKYNRSIHLKFKAVPLRFSVQITLKFQSNVLHIRSSFLRSQHLSLHYVNFFVYHLLFVLFVGFIGCWVGSAVFFSGAASLAFVTACHFASVPSTL